MGGGSDLPAFYRRQRGAVISTAIDKYIYVTVNKKFDSGIRVAYSHNEEVDSVELIKHKLVKASMNYLGIKGGVEITTIADIPSQGTGLGSSSSFTVGLLQALSAYSGHYISSERLAADACSIEIDICKEPIGKQDQYAAAFGGFNLIEFLPDENVLVEPIICKASTMSTLQDNIIVFYTGITRSASAILSKQSQAISSHKIKNNILASMVKLVYVMKDELQRNNPDCVGALLHENWVLKKSITDDISNSAIDYLYELARQAGAEGGKILGAGAGGFLMLYAPKDKHSAIKHALKDLRHVPISFEPLGARIIFYH